MDRHRRRPARELAGRSRSRPPVRRAGGNEEAIYILEGRATLRLGDQALAVAAGDYIALPVGAAHAHQLINASGAPVRYLCMSTTQIPEVAIYPDSRKVGVFGGAGEVKQYHRVGETLPYYDGEDG